MGRHSWLGWSHLNHGHGGSQKVTVCSQKHSSGCLCVFPLSFCCCSWHIPSSTNMKHSAQHTGTIAQLKQALVDSGHWDDYAKSCERVT